MRSSLTSAGVSSAAPDFFAPPSICRQERLSEPRLRRKLLHHRRQCHGVRRHLPRRLRANHASNQHSRDRSRSQFPHSGIRTQVGVELLHHQIIQNRWIRLPLAGLHHLPNKERRHRPLAARNCSTCFGFAAIASSTSFSIAPLSEICCGFSRSVHHGKVFLCSQMPCRASPSASCSKSHPTPSGPQPAPQSIFRNRRLLRLHLRRAQTHRNLARQQEATRRGLCARFAAASN